MEHVVMDVLRDESLILILTLSYKTQTLSSRLRHCVLQDVLVTKSTAVNHLKFYIDVLFEVDDLCLEQCPVNYMSVTTNGTMRCINCNGTCPLGK